MKTLKLIIAGLFALAGLVTVAQAQGIVGDLVVGFRDQPDNVPTNYEIDLGFIGLYVNLAPNTAINLSGNLAAIDLASIFGSNWNTSGNVTWGAAAAGDGGGQAPPLTSWVTQAGGTMFGLFPGGAPPPSKYQRPFGLNQSSPRAHTIETVETGLTPANGFVLSANAGNLTGFMPTASPASWSSWLNNPNNGFGGPATPIDAGTGLALLPGEYSVVNLEEYAPPGPGPGTYFGSLELGADGSLFFTNYVPAIPETSSYAAVLGATALGFVLIRRRQRIFA